jgi:hypothetical protein
MRNRTRIAGVAALAVAGVFAAVGTASAVNTTQTIDGTITPSDLPAGKFKPASVNIDVSTETTPPGLALDPSTQAVIDFDDSIKFTTKGMKTCTVGKIQGTTTDEALEACKKAKVGTGSGVARLGTTNVPAVVTAFNGKDKSILLHSRVDAASTTAILVGDLVNSDNEDEDYGKALDVAVPPLTGGAAIAQFETTVKKKFTVKKNGKKKTFHYVSAKCDDDDNTLNYAGLFTFDPAAGDNYSLSATDEQECT